MQHILSKANNPKHQRHEHDPERDALDHLSLRHSLHHPHWAVIQNDFIHTGLLADKGTQTGGRRKLITAAVAVFWGTEGSVPRRALAASDLRIRLGDSRFVKLTPTKRFHMLARSFRAVLLDASLPRHRAECGGWILVSHTRILTHQIPRDTNGEHKCKGLSQPLHCRFS
jgi:hypothetical protein